MRILLLTSLLVFVASCSLSMPQSPDNATSTQPSTSSQTPVSHQVQSSSTEVKDNMITTPTYGTGKHQIEIFADFQCPACISTNKSVQPIFEEFAASGKLTIVFRQFPLSMHKNARGDAIAALCSAEQGGYMDYKHALYALEESRAGKTVDNKDRIKIAKDLGLNEETFAQCLSTEKYAKQVESDIALGDSRGVSGTPTIYLDGIKIDMSLFRDIDGFRSFLENRIK